MAIINRAAPATFGLLLLLVLPNVSADALQQAGTATAKLGEVPYGQYQVKLSMFTTHFAAGDCTYENGLWAARGYAVAKWWSPQLTGNGVSIHGDPSWEARKPFQTGPYYTPTPGCGNLDDQAGADADAQASAYVSRYFAYYEGSFQGTISAAAGGVAAPNTQLEISGFGRISPTVGTPTYIVSMFNAEVSRNGATLCACGSISAHGA